MRQDSMPDRLERLRPVTADGIQAAFAHPNRNHVHLAALVHFALTVDPPRD